jgi:hypothetical protein
VEELVTQSNLNFLGDSSKTKNTKNYRKEEKNDGRVKGVNTKYKIA